MAWAVNCLALDVVARRNAGDEVEGDAATFCGRRIGAVVGSGIVGVCTLISGIFNQKTKGALFLLLLLFFSFPFLSLSLSSLCFTQSRGERPAQYNA